MNTSCTFSHRDYFRRYRLNVEQYGEIVVAEAFGGEKMGDSQPGYDIRIGVAAFLNALRAAGIDTARMVLDQRQEICVEVKSKLSRTSTGNARVVHCSESKLSGKRPKPGRQCAGMTHMVVLIVNPGSRAGDEQEGHIEHAWLLNAGTAAELRRKPGKAQYISIPQLEQCKDCLEIAPLLNGAADKCLSY